MYLIFRAELLPQMVEDSLPLCQNARRHVPEYQDLSKILLYFGMCSTSYPTKLTSKQ
jgi:hypothetical protein